MLKLKLQYFGHLMRGANSLEKTLMLGKTEGRKRRGGQRVRWLDGVTAGQFEQAPGDGEGQGSLVGCSPWGCKESDRTEWLNNKNDKNQPALPEYPAKLTHLSSLTVLSPDSFFSPTHPIYLRRVLLKTDIISLVSVLGPYMSLFLPKFYVNFFGWLSASSTIWFQSDLLDFLPECVVSSRLYPRKTVFFLFNLLIVYLCSYFEPPLELLKLHHL